LYFADAEEDINSAQISSRVAIGAAEGCTFWNYDPICGNKESISGKHFKYLVFDINPEQTHRGTVLFNRYRSDIWFESMSASPGGAKVHYGTMVLQNGASFGAGDSNFLNGPANRGQFTLEEAATLRIAYGQNIMRYTFDDGTFRIESTMESMPYVQDMLSEIGAGTTILRGKLQFVLPPNVTEGSTMLSIPRGTVFIGQLATIDVGVNACTDDASGLSVGQSVLLLDCTALTCEVTNFPDCRGETIPGVQPGYQFHVWKNANRILANFLGEIEESSSAASSSGSGSNIASSSGGSSSGGSSSSSVASSSGNSPSSSNSGSSAASSNGGSSSGSGNQSLPEVGVELPHKALSEGWLAGTTLVNGCGDRLEIPQPGELSVFGSAGAGGERHKTGSTVELRSASLAAGLADGIGPLTYGTFFEGAFAKTRTEDESNKETELTGKGRALACGGGVFCAIASEQVNWGQPRLEVALRAGSLKNKWDGEGSAAGLTFSRAVPYFGVRTAFGGHWENRHKYSIGFYGKYSWSHLNRKKIPNGEVSFRSIDSHRVRLGGRLAYPSDWKLAPWFGAYYERELAGTAKGTVGGQEIPRPSLRGGRTAGELGLSFRPRPTVAVDLALQGSADSEKSISASLKGKYEF
jgi:hypothetical protein